MTLDPRQHMQISASSGVPIYRQIMDQINGRIAAGRLKQGDFLPSVRAVAKALEVNPMTVSKAYSLLEKDGVVEGVRGQGMRVAQVAKAAKDVKSRDREILPLIKQAVNRAKQQSLSKKHVLALIEKMWKE